MEEAPQNAPVYKERKAKVGAIVYVLSHLIL